MCGSKAVAKLWLCKVGLRSKFGNLLPPAQETPAPHSPPTMFIQQKVSEETLCLGLSKSCMGALIHVEEQSAQDSIQKSDEVLFRYRSQVHVELFRMSFCFVSAEKIEGAFEVPDRGRENAIRHNSATDAKYNARAISLHDAERRSSSSSFSVERECVYSGPERTLIRSWVMLLHRHVFHLNIANVPFFVRGTPSLHDFRSRSCAQLRCDSS